MKIRNKLTYLFVSIVALILLLSSLAIYYFSADYREEDFYNRLLSKGSNTAKLLIEVEEVDAELLQRIEADNPQSLNSEKLYIFNYRDEILFSIDEGDTPLVIPEGLLDRVRLEGEVRYVQNGSEVLGFMFTDQYDRFVVVVGAKDVFGLRKIRNLRIILLFVFIGGVIIASFFGWIYAGRALKPISKVVKEVDGIGISNLDQRIDEGNSRDEIARLASTFNKMLDRMEKAFTMQRNFIANSSHELRTPLTAITGQLEVVLMNPRSPEEYKKVIESVLDDIVKLNMRTNQLLLLARASAETTKTEFHPTRIDEVLWNSRAELLKSHPDYQIRISADEAIDDEEKLTVVGNEQLLKSAIINLLDNGCKYSENKTVRVSMTHEKGEVVLKFRDRGIGIPQADRRLIFEPFHRSANALTVRGHGIGLSLVWRIVQLHEGKIEVNSVPGEGSTFTLRLNSLKNPVLAR